MEIIFDGLGDDRQVKLRPSVSFPTKIVWQQGKRKGKKYDVAFEIEEARLLANSMLSLCDIIQAEKDSGKP